MSTTGLISFHIHLVLVPIYLGTVCNANQLRSIVEPLGKLKSGPLNDVCYGNSYVFPYEF